MAEAQVEAVALQGAQPGGQPVHLEVAVEGGLTGAGGDSPRGVEPAGQVGDGALETAGDGCEVALVVGDEGRVGLGGEVGGQVEGADGSGLVLWWGGRHVLGSDRDRVRVPRRS